MSEDDLEKAYWRFDAMCKGLHPFEGRKEYSERDNFKEAVRFHSQSVAHIEAAALRRVAEEWEWHVGEELRGEADRIEQKGEVDVTVCTECVQPYEAHRAACPYCIEQAAKL